MTQLQHKILSTYLDDLKIVVNERALVAILWSQEKTGRVPLESSLENPDNPLILETEKQLLDYLDSKRQSFTVPFELNGTPFQKKVWEFLQKIPFGRTCSYKEIAQQMDHPKAIRAVGTAIGKNPLSIIVPCHRVIGASGSLTGFAGGLAKKQILLNLEIKKIS